MWENSDINRWSKRRAITKALQQIILHPACASFLKLFCGIMTEEVEKVLLNFVHENSATSGKVHKEVHSMNQGHRASTSGCSLVGGEELDQSHVLNSTRRHDHLSFEMSCLSHSTNPISSLGTHSSASTKHWLPFQNVTAVKWVMAPSQETFPCDSCHQNSTPRFCYIQIVY